MTEQSERRDLLRQPVSFMIAWGAPIAIIIAANSMHMLLPFKAVVVVIATCFAWMGTACLANAKRCGRLHCFLSGPVLLASAVAVLLVGLRIVSLGESGLIYVVWGAFGLVVLTFIPEMLRGRYVRR